MIRPTASRRCQQSSTRVMGQGGMTIIELLIVISVGTIVLIPMFGLVNQTLLRRQPTIESANDSKQMRLFRSAIAKDWAAAEVIKIGVGAADTECNQGSMSAFLSPNVGPRIAMQISQVDSTTDKRVIYNTRPTIDPYDSSDAIDVLRRECNHVPQMIGGADYWGLGSSVNDPGGSQEVLLRDVKELRIPGTCNLQANWPKSPPLRPYEMCDMNVTIIGLDGQTTTVRLYQHTGRDS